MLNCHNCSSVWVVEVSCFLLAAETLSNYSIRNFFIDVVASNHWFNRIALFFSLTHAALVANQLYGTLYKWLTCVHASVGVVSRNLQSRKFSFAKFAYMYIAHSRKYRPVKKKRRCSITAIWCKIPVHVNSLADGGFTAWNIDYSDLFMAITGALQLEQSIQI